MNITDEMKDDTFIFGALLVVANRMETLLERELKEFDITAKQWFLSIVVENLFQKPPTMKEAAKQMGSSHQNVKQVALKLEQKGLLKLEKDKKDARVTRILLTEQSYLFWQKMEPKGSEFTKNLFSDINSEELKGGRALLQKMLINLDRMEETGSSKGKGEII